MKPYQTKAIMTSLIVMALIATLLLPSCSKKYDCTCTFVDSTGKATQEIVGAMNDWQKSRAQKECDDAGKADKSFYTSVSCHLN